MRNLLLRLAVLFLSLPALSQTVATYTFEQGLDGFTPATAPQVAQETVRPLVGAGALRLTLDEKAKEMTVTSPEFTVQPWTLYRVRLRQNTDLGANLLVGIELNAANGWRKASYYVIPDAGGEGLFGTFPDSVKARLSLTLQIPGQTLGRVSVADEIAISREGALIKEAGPNLYWDGGFELGKNDMAYWVKEPKKMEVSADRPRGGQRCLHVESDHSTYIVFPFVPVESRHLYRFRAWVRGTGTVYSGMHRLAPTDWLSMRADTAVRVGWAGSVVDEVRLRPDTWQQIEIVTPCESDRITWFDVYLPFNGGVLDIDDAELVSLQE